MVYIGDKFRIKKYDNVNLVLEKLTDVKNKVTNEITPMWKIEGYYGNIKHIIDSIINIKCFDIIEAKDFDISEFNKKLENIKNELLEKIIIEK